MGKVLIHFCALVSFVLLQIDRGPRKSRQTCTRHKMDNYAVKTKLIRNRADVIRRDSKVKRHKLGTLTSFKHLRAVVPDDISNWKFSQGLHKPLQLLQS